MAKRVLITGGAGFIGSHLADELIRHNYHVRVLDNLSEQVHGPGATRPQYLAREVELIVGDVCDAMIVRDSLDGVDCVFHLAACVGVGQSMYDIARYTAVNNYGTAILLEELIDHPVQKLVVASSMSIYGEGLYKDARGDICSTAGRNIAQLKAGLWDIGDDAGSALIPVATPESKVSCLSSVYALSKFDQEQMCLIFGKAYGIDTTALRFFNVYGTRQALSNPYTGVLAIFISRLLNNKAPLIYEDGRQLRDFVSVYDVARACRLAMESPRAAGEVFNIGSGHKYTIQQIAARLGAEMGKNIKPQITGKYRVGDVRHCFADVTKAKEMLGFSPQVPFEHGIKELVEWVQSQEAIDKAEEAVGELDRRKLMI